MPQTNAFNPHSRRWSLENSQRLGYATGPQASRLRLQGQVMFRPWRLELKSVSGKPKFLGPAISEQPLTSIFTAMLTTRNCGVTR